jgi:hypothetical protein
MGRIIHHSLAKVTLAYPLVWVERARSLLGTMEIPALKDVPVSVMARLQRRIHHWVEMRFPTRAHFHLDGFIVGGVIQYLDLHPVLGIVQACNVLEDTLRARGADLPLNLGLSLFFTGPSS